MVLYWGLVYGGTRSLYDISPTSRTEAVMQRAMFIQGSRAGVMAGLGGGHPAHQQRKSAQGETTHVLIRSFGI